VDTLHVCVHVRACVCLKKKFNITREV